MLIKLNIFSFIVGSIIGSSQVYIRVFLNTKVTFQSLLILSIMIVSYFLAGFIWLGILKSQANLTSCYSFTILGTFTSIIIGKIILSSGSSILNIRDVIGLILIFLGTLLIKR
tara:strand:+ start:1046 stop:1384 length:339 start_codon:yes stop_codon:yes gene_type:complete